MGHIEKKLKEQPWYSLLWYGSKKLDDLMRNAPLIMKVGKENTSFCRKQMLACIMTQNIVIHQQVMAFLGKPQDYKINDRSVVWDAEFIKKLPSGTINGLTKKRVEIIPQQYIDGKEKVLLIFPKSGSALEKFREASLQIATS